MILVLKRLWWKRKKRRLSAWLLNDMRKVINGWKIFQIFWRKTESFQEVERESIKPVRLLSYQIHFTQDYLTMRENYTKASTSQSFQRNFLIRCKKL